MLRLMRNKFKSLKWVLWLVIASFVGLVFFGWGMGAGGGGIGGPRAGGNAVAEVAGAKISPIDVRRRMDDERDRYRQFGEQARYLLDRVTPSTALEQLINYEVALHEARNAGLRVDSDEVATYLIEQGWTRERLLETVPRTRYRTEKAFRKSIADDLLFRKFQALVEASAVVTDAEARAQYVEQNDKTEIEHVYFDGAKLDEGSAEPSDDEVSAFYAANGAKFEAMERTARYVVFAADDYRDKVTLTADEVRAAFDDRNESGEYDAEKRRARHILLKTSGDDPAAAAEVEARARALLAELEGGGAEFEALAREHSEDDSNAAAGGDLGWFGRGRMVPAFDEATFTAEVGKVIGPVKTNFGYHLIRVDGIRQPNPEFATVADELRVELIRERALAAAREAADAALAADGADLASVAAAAAAPYQDSGFFRRDQPPASLAGISAPYRTSFAWTLFNMETPGSLAERTVPTDDGAVIVEYGEERGPVVPPLDEIRSQVVRELRVVRGRDEAKLRADELSSALASGMSLADAAAAVDGEVQTASVYRRAGTISGVPASEPAFEVAYALPVGETSAPIVLERGVVVLKVNDRFAFTDDGYAEARDQVRSSLESQRGSEIWRGVLDAARADLQQRGEIRYYIAPGQIDSALAF